MTLRRLSDLTLTQNFDLGKETMASAVEHKKMPDLVEEVIRHFVLNFGDYFKDVVNRSKVIASLVCKLYDVDLSKKAHIQIKTTFYVDDGKEPANTMQLQDREARALFYEIQRTIEHDETMTREDFVRLRKASMKFLVHFQKEYE